MSEQHREPWTCEDATVTRAAKYGFYDADDKPIELRVVAEKINALKAEIATLRAEHAAEVAGLKAEIAASKECFRRWTEYFKREKLWPFGDKTDWLTHDEATERRALAAPGEQHEP
jgi:hypothetical protein